MLPFMKRFKADSILVSVLTVLVGLLLIVMPDTAVLTVCTLVGWLMAVGGVMTIFSFIVNREMFFGIATLIMGIAELLLGVWIIHAPGAMLSVLGLLLGLILMLHGFHDLQYGLDCRRAGASNWGWALVIGTVIICLGVVTVVNPLSTTASLLMLAGVCLLADGVFSLLTILRLSKAMRDLF